MEQDNQVDPVAAITEKRTVLDKLIDNSLAIPIFAETSNGVRISEIKHPGDSFTNIKKTVDTERKILGVMIQVSPDSFIVTSYHDLQMQVIQPTKEFMPNTRLEDISANGEVILTGEINRNPTPIDLFRRISHIHSCTVLSDSSKDPDKVIDTLTMGLSWLKDKQQKELAKRTQASQGFVRIINDFLNTGK